MNGRIQTLDKDFLWVNASARLHEGMDAFKNNKPSLTGVGPGLFFAKSLTEMIDDQNDERIRKEINFNPRSFEDGVKCLVKNVRENQ